VKWKSFFVETHFFLEVAERPEGVPAPFWKKGFLQKRLLHYTFIFIGVQ
jgi:hypothetical protein